MILIVAPHTDEHAVAVRSELERRGERVVVFDPAELPTLASISVALEPGHPFSASVARTTDSFDLEEVEAVWLRRTSQPKPKALGDAWYAASECNHLLVGLAQSLRRCRWVNGLHSLALDGGWGKIRQLQVAREVGLEVPRTLATNDPEKARSFVESCSGGSVFKPFASREGQKWDGTPSAIFTTEITDEWAEKLWAVAHAPVILQEKIAKKCDIRVTVIGDRVFACAVDSQSDPASSVDYRHRYTQVPHARHELPAEVSAGLVAIHRGLGLVFGTADLVLTPDGRYVFLETNQQGQWLWTAHVFGEGVLVGAFSDLLQGKR